MRQFINNLYLEICGGRRKIRKQNRNPIAEWPNDVVSNKMGFDRGTPIDRVYIARFLQEHKKYITGNVVEIGDNAYTLEYGKNINKSFVLTADEKLSKCGKSIIIYGDLQNGKGCQSNIADCFILTQTFPFIYDINNAARNVMEMLKPGGAALITVSGISMISKYDDERWGHFWGFTETSLRRLFDGIAGRKQIEVYSMGNPKTASAFIYGLSKEDLDAQDFLMDDALIPVIIGVVVHKL
nr:hypothetical protein [uncultured Eisenbergiella sp.]